MTICDAKKEGAKTKLRNRLMRDRRFERKKTMKLVHTRRPKVFANLCQAESGHLSLSVNRKATNRCCLFHLFRCYTANTCVLIVVAAIDYFYCCCCGGGRCELFGEGKNVDILISTLLWSVRLE